MHHKKRMLDSRFSRFYGSLNCEMPQGTTVVIALWLLTCAQLKAISILLY